MSSAFNFAFDFLMENEGGSKYTNDPNDSGGPTKFGITKKTYEEWARQCFSINYFRGLTENQARDFYFETHWLKLNCNKMDKAGVAICIFDSAVLYGVITASLLAQKTLIKLGFPIKSDGLIGDMTLEALNKVSQGEFLLTFRELVLERIEKIISARPKDERYRKGWTNRADRLLTLNNDARVINSST